MTAKTIPTIPSFPAGYIVQQADLINLSSACNFLLNKPMTKVVDTAGGQSIPTGFGSPPWAGTIQFTTALYDVDGMWNASNPKQLTIQTPGWYKIRYGISVGAAVAGTVNMNSVAFYTLGPNNPGGPGTPSPWFYSSYTGNNIAGFLRGSGIVPFYLYSGDYVQIAVVSNTGGKNTVAPGNASGYNGCNNFGSYMSLEFVSAT